MLEAEWLKSRVRLVQKISKELRPAKVTKTDISPYSQNPVMSGLAMTSVLLDEQETALDSIDRWFAVIPMAHLYNVLRQLGYLEIEWKSMETLTTAYTPEYIFFGGRPTTLLDCLTRLKLTFGLSVNMSLPIHNGRVPEVKITRQHRKLRERVSPFSRAFHRWMLPTTAGRQAGVDERTLRDGGLDSFQIDGLLLPLLQQAVASSEKKKKSASQLQPINYYKLEAVTFLESVQEGLAKEIQCCTSSSRV
jgi:hypothetical protein